MAKSTMRNMTEGSVPRHLFFFALPLMVGGLLQQFYNMVDSIVVGNFVSDEALAAVSVGWPISYLYIALFMGMGMGATVVISQYYGAGRHERVHDAIDTLYTAIVVGIVPLTILAILLIHPLLGLMQVEESCYDESYTYMFVMALGLIGTIGYNANAGILQGLGDSKTSLLFLAVAAVMNIIGDLVTVLVLDMGVGGVAFSTVGAQFVSWVFGIFYINRRYPQIAIHPFSRRFDRELFRKIIKIGLPAGIQQSIMSVGVIVLMSKINSFGHAYISAYNLGNKLDNMAWLPIQALASACTALVGQNVGAGDYGRAKKGIRAAVIMGVVWSIVIMCVLMPLREAAMGIFTDNAETIASGARYLELIFPVYPFLVYMFCVNNGMRGAGEIAYPTFCTIFSLSGLRLPLLYIIADTYGPYHMYYSTVISWFIGGVMTFIYYRTGRWMRHGSMAKKNEGEAVESA